MASRWFRGNELMLLVRELEPQQLCRNPQYPSPIHQRIQAADRRSGLNPADLGLSQAQPLTEQSLRDAVGAVDRVVVGVHAVGAGDAADVLGGEGFPELLGLPERGGHVGRGYAYSYPLSDIQKGPGQLAARVAPRTMVSLNRAAARPVSTLLRGESSACRNWIKPSRRPRLRHWNR